MQDRTPADLLQTIRQLAGKPPMIQIELIPSQVTESDVDRFFEQLLAGESPMISSLDMLDAVLAELSRPRSAAFNGRIEFVRRSGPPINAGTARRLRASGIDIRD